MRPTDFIRVRVSLPDNAVEAVRSDLLGKGIRVLRHPYEGEAVGGWSEWQGNVIFVLDVVERPGAIWATYEVVRRLLGRHADAATAVDIEEVDTTGRMILRCDVCDTEFYYGQTEHVPSRCPNIECQGQLGSIVGLVGSDEVMPLDAPGHMKRFSDAERRSFVAPICPLCDSRTMPEWRRVDELGEQWSVATFRCANWQSH